MKISFLQFIFCISLILFCSKTVEAQLKTPPLEPHPQESSITYDTLISFDSITNTKTITIIQTIHTIVTEYSPIQIPVFNEDIKVLAGISYSCNFPIELSFNEGLSDQQPVPFSNAGISISMQDSSSMFNIGLQLWKYKERLSYEFPLLIQSTVTNLNFIDSIQIITNGVIKDSALYETTHVITTDTLYKKIENKISYSSFLSIPFYWSKQFYSTPNLYWHIGGNIVVMTRNASYFKYVERRNKGIYRNALVLYLNVGLNYQYKLNKNTYFSAEFNLLKSLNSTMKKQNRKIKQLFIPQFGIGLLKKI